MEYRREPRFEANQSVTVTDLEHPSPSFPGYLVNFSLQGIRLFMERGLAAGTAVKVQWPGTMLLGEVIYCRPSEEGYWAGLELVDALYDTEALAVMTGRQPHPDTRPSDE